MFSLLVMSMFFKDRLSLRCGVDVSSKGVPKRFSVKMAGKTAIFVTDKLSEKKIIFYLEIRKNGSTIGLGGESPRFSLSHTPYIYR